MGVTTIDNLSWLKRRGRRVYSCVLAASLAVVRSWLGQGLVRDEFPLKLLRAHIYRTFIQNFYTELICRTYIKSFYTVLIEGIAKPAPNF